MKNKLSYGWGWPDDPKNATGQMHYFYKGESLCGQHHNYSGPSTGDEEYDSPGDCAVCTRLLRGSWDFETCGECPFYDAGKCRILRDAVDAKTQNPRCPIKTEGESDE